MMDFVSEIKHDLIDTGVKVLVGYNNKRAIGTLYNVHKVQQEYQDQYIDCGSCRVQWKDPDNKHQHNESLQLVIVDSVQCVHGQVTVRYIEISDEKNAYLKHTDPNKYNVCICNMCFLKIQSRLIKSNLA